MLSAVFTFGMLMAAIVSCSETEQETIPMRKDDAAEILSQQRDKFYSKIRFKVIHNVPLDFDEEVYGYIVSQQLERECKSKGSPRMAD